MKVAGLLSWYDESPAWLATAVSGMARVCDEIIAVDGAYALYPSARPRSHPQQVEAVLQAAEAGGAGCTVHRPREVFWGNEVAKRNLTLALASAHLESGRDWLVIFDADWHVTEANPARFRHELEETDLDVALYTIVESLDFMANEHTAEYSKTDVLEPHWFVDGPIFRYYDSLRYGPAHFTLSRESDGERAWLAGPKGHLAPAHPLGRALVVYHRNQDRSLARRQAGESYYRARELHGIEELGADPLAAVSR